MVYSKCPGSNPQSWIYCHKPTSMNSIPRYWVQQSCSFPSEWMYTNTDIRGPICLQGQGNPISHLSVFPVKIIYLHTHKLRWKLKNRLKSYKEEQLPPKGVFFSQKWVWTDSLPNLSCYFISKIFFFSSPNPRSYLLALFQKGIFKPKRAQVYEKSKFPINYTQRW